MEHIWDWLVVLGKLLHLPFIAGLQINLREKDKFDFGDIGDNLPYVFLK